jgi:hypothetical protein
MHKRMAHLTRFCIDHNKEIFDVPTFIQSKLAVENQENKAVLTPSKPVFEEEKPVPKHKKIAELIEGDTPRKRAKIESPSKSPSTATSHSPSKSPRRTRKQRGSLPFTVIMNEINNDHNKKKNR